MPFYAVRNGRVPGVYKDWASCEKQVRDFPKAKYKKFPTEPEAWAFVRGEQLKESRHVHYDDPVSTPADDEEGSQNSSVNISQEQKQHFSTASPTVKSEDKVADLSATHEVLNMLRATAKTLQSTAKHLISGIDALSTQIDNLAASLPSGAQGSFPAAYPPGGGGIRDSLKRSYSDFTPLGGAGSSGGGSSGKEFTKKYKRMRQNSECTDCGFTGVPFPDHEGQIVYTDGASFHNGCATARAGIGVYWGPHDPYNKSERLTGRQTNNRAEIKAAEIAVRQAKERGMKNVILYTDSQFLINGITAWIKKWKTNGWKLSTGGDVINREDFEKLDDAITGMNVKWMHVRGHRGNEGNEAADRLANEGAKKPLV